ncbi:protein of unknown function [Burkholderia multivorans]
MAATPQQLRLRVRAVQPCCGRPCRPMRAPAPIRPAINPDWHSIQHGMYYSCPRPLLDFFFFTERIAPGITGLIDRPFYRLFITIARKKKAICRFIFSLTDGVLTSRA